MNRRPVTILGQTCYARLQDVPVHVDIVNVFQALEAWAGGTVSVSTPSGVTSVRSGLQCQGGDTPAPLAPRAPGPPRTPPPASLPAHPDTVP